MVLKSQTEVLVCRLVCRCSSRLVDSDKDICDGYAARHSPLGGRCGAAVVKKRSRTFLFHCSLLAPSHLEGVKQHLGGKRWMLRTNGLMDYHGCKNNYSFDALQAYCFGINIKL